MDGGLSSIAPGVAGRVDALYRASPQPPLEGLVAVLVNALVDLPDETTLVLDDYGTPCTSSSPVRTPQPSG
jgi:hypothetical protein